MKLNLIAALLLKLFLPVPVFAIFSCDVPLQKQNFSEEVKQLQREEDYRISTIDCLARNDRLLEFCLKALTALQAEWCTAKQLVMGGNESHRL